MLVRVFGFSVFFTSSRSRSTPLFLPFRGSGTPLAKLHHGSKMIGAKKFSFFFREVYVQSSFAVRTIKRAENLHTCSSYSLACIRNTGTGYDGKCTRCCTRP